MSEKSKKVSAILEEVQEHNKIEGFKKFKVSITDNPNSRAIKFREFLHTSAIPVKNYPVIFRSSKYYYRDSELWRIIGRAYTPGCMV